MQAVARRRAEKARDEARERYLSLYNHMLTMVYIVDLQGHVIDANPALLDMIGYSREEAIGMNMVNLIVPEHIPLVTAGVQEIMQTGTSKQFVAFMLRRKDGRYVEVETTGTLLFHDGKPYAIQGMARDITERKRVRMPSRRARKGSGRSLRARANGFGRLTPKVSSPIAVRSLRRSQAIGRMSWSGKCTSPTS
ncbi:MAG: PAS domain S-box protein [Methanomassiliicoccales archaeon]|jgi:PAS domain S-box-containing protein